MLRSIHCNLESLAFQCVDFNKLFNGICPRVAGRATELYGLDPSSVSMLATPLVTSRYMWRGPLNCSSLLSYKNRGLPRASEFRHFGGTLHRMLSMEIAHPPPRQSHGVRGRLGCVHKGPQHTPRSPRLPLGVCCPLLLDRFKKEGPPVRQLP